MKNMLRAMGARLFLAHDRQAIDLGWQVVPGRWGLSRTYRDRRFDALVRPELPDEGGAAAEQEPLVV